MEDQELLFYSLHELEHHSFLVEENETKNGSKECINIKVKGKETNEH